MRKKRNTIIGLRCDDGTVTNSDEEIGEEALKFFHNLFTSNNSGDGTYLLSGINHVISNEDNEILLAQFTEEDIFVALKSMSPTKAPGFDGYPIIFFRNFGRLSNLM